MNQNKVIAFEKIDNAYDLKAFLQHYGGMRENKGFLHHYNSLSTVISLFKNRTWHLSQASCMNDILEFTNGDINKWNKLFFTSFMREDDENIGMWSMYGQPWNKGVKISIPKNIAVDWLTKEYIRVFEVDCRTKSTNDEISETLYRQPFLSAVAYANTDRINRKKEVEEVRYGTVRNSNLVECTRDPVLTGYIKDEAWAYEKEIRLCIEFKNAINCKRISLSIPDEVLDNIILTPSPLFEGDFMQELNREIEQVFKTKESLFKGKFQLQAKCDECNYVNLQHQLS